MYAIQISRHDFEQVDAMSKADYDRFAEGVREAVAEHKSDGEPVDAEA